MSFVGPRPAVVEEVHQYEPWQRRRLSMKPGLTCLWQVSGRNELTFDEWMRLDLEYIDNWSLWLDVKIAFKTIPAVLLRPRAPADAPRGSTPAPRSNQNARFSCRALREPPIAGHERCVEHFRQCDVDRVVVR